MESYQVKYVSDKNHIKKLGQRLLRRTACPGKYTCDEREHISSYQEVPQYWIALSFPLRVLLHIEDSR